MRRVVAESVGRPTVESVRRGVARALEAEVRAGSLVLPSRTTFHRLYAELEAAGPVFGRDRWPGRQVVVDAARLPALALPHGGQQELEVVFAWDVDTEVVLTAVVRQPSRPVDGAALLAQMWMPADRRASWLAEPQVPVPKVMGASLSLPPLIRPRTLVMDRAFTRPPAAETCRRHGLLVRAAPGPGGYPRGRAEVVVRRLADSSSAFLRSVRGDAARDAGWPVGMVQDLLDAWVQDVWNHGELHYQQGDFTGMPTRGSRALRYMELTARAGWVATPPSPQAFASLLPAARWRVTAAGLYVDGRRYDSPALDVLRGYHPVEVRRDPSDIRRVWASTAQGTWVAVRATAPPPRRPRDGDPARLPLSSSPRRPATGAPERSRIEYHAGLPLHTPGVEVVIRRAEELLLLNKHAAGARSGLVLIGATGTGKTTALLALARSCTAQARLHAEGPRVPAVYVRVAPATTPRTFLTELARQASAPVRARAGMQELAAETSDALQRLGTGLVLVDEFEYLHGARGSATPLFDIVDNLCDRVPATFVFAGRSAILPRLAPSRRLLPLALGPMPCDDGWIDFLARAEAALRLHRHVPGTLPDMAGHLHQLTGGRADRLGYLLRSGAIRAIRDGHSSAT